MSTTAFKTKKKVGMWFQNLLYPEMESLGLEVIDTDKLSYNRKRGVDCVVKLKNKDGSYKLNSQGFIIFENIEIKYDAMSEQTGNVYIEQGALDHSRSAIWLYGLPDASKIDCYSVLLSNLREYAPKLGTPVLGGEYGTTGYLIPKSVFTSQSWVHHWKIINLQPSERNTTRQSTHPLSQNQRTPRTAH
jgi:hypothetical protein